MRSNGSVACWGSDYWHSDYYGQATPPAGSFVSVNAGVNHTCGVKNNGSVACWGSNGHGQSTPPAGSFVSVNAGWIYTCGVRSNGSVACWGRDFNGVATPPAGSFVSVSAGTLHTCGVRSGGSVACWGSNGDGQSRPPAGSFVSVNAGQLHTCGLRSNGSVACWGRDGNGQATPLSGSFVSVSTGSAHTCGLRSNGSVACWGSDEYGQATPSAGSFDSANAGINPIDDHGNSEERATQLTSKSGEIEDIRGALDYDGDIDYFRLGANRGRTYQIDVALGTLDDSIVKLYDDDGLLLVSNDGYGGTFASRLFLEVPSNGYYYIAVEGYGIGTYTLTVSFVDDHGNDFESATRIAIGERVRIDLHNYDDRDMLAFRARPGTEYVFTLYFFTGQRTGGAPGTTMVLYDASGRVLARLRNFDFYSNSSRNMITWQAPTGGDYYILVGNEAALGIFELIVNER